MTDTKPIIASKKGAQSLKELLAKSKTVGSTPPSGTRADLRADSIALKLSDVPEDGDIFTPFDVRQVKLSDGQFIDVQLKRVQLVGGRSLAVNTGSYLTLVSTSIHLDVQLTEDMDAATNFATGPATALANVLVRNASGDLEKLVYDGQTVQVMVVNRYEHWETVEAETFGGVILKNDEWRPDDFDCEAAQGGLI